MDVISFKYTFESGSGSVNGIEEEEDIGRVLVEFGVKKRSIRMMSMVDDPKMVNTQRQKEFNWLHANEVLHEVQISECCCLLTPKTTGKL